MGKTKSQLKKLKRKYPQRIQLVERRKRQLGHLPKRERSASQGSKKTTEQKRIQQETQKMGWHWTRRNNWIRKMKNRTNILSVTGARAPRYWFVRTSACDTRDGGIESPRINWTNGNLITELTFFNGKRESVLEKKRWIKEYVKIL